jgi:hypothetical protein
VCGLCTAVKRCMYGAAACHSFHHLANCAHRQHLSLVRARPPFGVACFRQHGLSDILLSWPSLANLQPRPHSGKTAQRTDAWVRRHSSQGEEAAPPGVVSSAAAGAAARAAERSPPPPSRRRGRQPLAAQMAVPVGSRISTPLPPGAGTARIHALSAYTYSKRAVKQQLIELLCRSAHGGIWITIPM